MLAKKSPPEEDNSSYEHVKSSQGTKSPKDEGYFVGYYENGSN